MPLCPFDFGFLLCYKEGKKSYKFAETCRWQLTRFSVNYLQVQFDQNVKRLQRFWQTALYLPTILVQLNYHTYFWKHWCFKNKTKNHLTQKFEGGMCEFNHKRRKKFGFVVEDVWLFTRAHNQLSRFFLPPFPEKEWSVDQSLCHKQTACDTYARWALKYTCSHISRAWQVH